uniref:Uncharacterized protein n=1 Tax=Meloidogyne floridensis TaxID=298350 RepID=A0A915NPN0_9BILA
MRLSQPIVQCGNIQTANDNKNARRRSHSATRSFTDSTVNFMGRIGQSLRIASSSTNRKRLQNKQEKQQQESEETQQQQQQQQLPAEITSGRRQSLAEQWFRTVRMRRRGARGIAGTQSEELSRKNFIDQHQPRPHNLLIGQEKQNNKELIMPAGEEDDEEIKSSSPLSSSSAGFGCSAAVSRSCPPTPRPAMRQRYLKEGYCQLTSIQTLSQHNRYVGIGK